jgi:hypothetical protein
MQGRGAECWGLGDGQTHESLLGAQGHARQSMAAALKAAKAKVDQYYVAPREGPRDLPGLFQSAVAGLGSAGGRPMSAGGRPGPPAPAGCA